jgi:hypothetical protein
MSIGTWIPAHWFKGLDGCMHWKEGYFFIKGPLTKALPLIAALVCGGPTPPAAMPGHAPPATEMSRPREKDTSGPGPETPMRGPADIGFFPPAFGPQAFIPDLGFLPLGPSVESRPTAALSPAIPPASEFLPPIVPTTPGECCIVTPITPTIPTFPGAAPPEVPAPEPSSLLIVSIGLAGLRLAKRSRRTHVLIPTAL